jgi:hypothetical protein
MALAQATRYSGRLGVEPEALDLHVWTRFDAESVELSTVDGERFEWSLDTVAATPYDTRVMELQLDGSLLYFVADDPLSFADDLTETLHRMHPHEMTERTSRWSTRTADPLDRRTTIPVLRPTHPAGAAPPIRRRADRDRLVPLGRKGKLRRPKNHTHVWTATDTA